MAIKLNGSTSGSVALDAPADTSPSGTDVTLTLPTSAGSSGQYLQTNGSGTLSWQTLPNSGKILQVQSTSKLDAFTGSSTSFADITGMTVSITPTAADSNILIDANFVVSNTAGGRSMYFNLLRGSTNIAQPSTGNANDCTIQCNTIDYNYNIVVAKIQFLDDPTYTLGDTITYKIQYKVDSGTVAIGRRGDRANELSISTITAMEVAA